MIGTAPSSTLLKSAKDLTKKEVFCISYTADDVTCDGIASFVKSINVKVLSSFDAKTRVPDTKSFRKCIEKANRKEFLNKDNWPCNISVCQWSLKNVNNDKAAVPTDSTVDAPISTDVAMSPSKPVTSPKLATSLTMSLCNIGNNTTTC